ncbi:hypothetical protein SCHPADRAFT_885189 [Schizopora paradoxa]|uniref:Uncharacterized protein n=1 Tax=Schizopora paradoxa TaxID=27342 RepID=A0A0H2SE38_9AGAM|nr:hypothetical protein SCHPADRAFT_885189 [Schizopora paradoxa]
MHHRILPRHHRDDCLLGLFAVITIPVPEHVRRYRSRSSLITHVRTSGSGSKNTSPNRLFAAIESTQGSTGTLDNQVQDIHLAYVRDYPTKRNYAPFSRSFCRSCVYGYVSFSRDINGIGTRLSSAREPNQWNLDARGAWAAGGVSGTFSRKSVFFKIFWLWTRGNDGDEQNRQANSRICAVSVSGYGGAVYLILELFAFEDEWRSLCILEANSNRLKI